MAKGNMFLGYARGKVGDVVLTRMGGQQVERAYNKNPKNPQSESQQLQRTKLANLVNFYRRGRSLLNHSFTNRPASQSSYNQFVSRNIGVTPIRLTRAQAAAGASIVGPYIISDGVLQPIQVTGGGVDAVTNIAVGGLTINDETTTVGQLSAAIIANNADWQEGDQLTYVSVVQNGGVDGGDPFAQFSYIEMDLVPSDTTPLRSLMPTYALSVRNGFIGHGEYVADGGYAWIHSRKSSAGALQASRQSLILTANTLYADYASSEQTNAATRSYGAQGDYLLVPDGSKAGQEMEGVPVIASVTLDGALLRNGKEGFGASYSTSSDVTIVISGSNLELEEGQSPEEVVGVSFKNQDNEEIVFNIDEIVSNSKTAITVKGSPSASISASDYGTVTVTFNNQMGGYVEQTYSIAQSSSGSGTGGNPL